MTRDEKIAKLLDERSRHIKAAERQRRFKSGLASDLTWVHSDLDIRDCDRQLNELGHVWPDQERRIIQILTEGV